MISARSAAVALFALWACGCASVHPAGEGPLVDSLEIRGNQAIPAGEIRARILTSGTSWVPFSERHYLDESVFETDLRRIVRLYQARGYYKARIADRQVVETGKGKVEVLVTVDEGAPTLVEKLAVEGIDRLPETLRTLMLQGLPLKEGEPFAEEAFDRTKASLQERLREAGYAEAEVEGSAQVRLQEDRAEVSLLADVGRRYRFGRVFVAGANRVPRMRILELAKVDVVEGAFYSESALVLAEGRIFDLGVFSAVKVTRGAPDRRGGTVPVVVNVREAPFRTIRVGAGVGFDQARQELPRLVGEWTNRNFFGGLRRLTWANQLALVFVPDVIQGFDSPLLAGSSKLEFAQPNLLSSDLSFEASLAYDRGVVDQDLTYHAGTVRFGLPWRLGRRLTLVPSVNLSAAVFSTTLAPGQVDQEMAFDACAASGKLCRLAYLEQRVIYDRRDNPVDPTRGYMLSFALQEGSGYFGGGYDYLRLEPEARGYLPMGRHVLAARLTAGMLLPSEGQTSSVLTRFFLGGSSSQRGFGTRQLSPRVVGALPEDGVLPDDAMPVGGNGMLSGSLEARFRLPASFGLVAFVDAGEVQPSFSDMSLDGLNLAVGLGLRNRTMFGPVRFDVGYRVNDPGIPVYLSSGDQVGLLRSGQLSRWSLHFSIGEAF
ncbi:MAG TPA: hypothetical protein DFS52_01340 [Myxococcales bacterium]|nr:hypothetical protein [Myxococcales bacterium]